MELTGVFSEIGWVNGLHYTFHVKSAKISDKDAEVTLIVGQHLDQKTNADVGAVHFENNDLKCFPRGLTKFFPNLRSLEVKRCQVSSISKADLIGLEKLDCLHLGNNLIKTLPNGLLAEMRELRYVYFIENQITHLSPQFLDPLDVTKCELVDFTNNSLINDFYQRGKRGSIKALKKVILKQCKSAVEKKCDSVVPNLMKNLLNSGLGSDFIIKVGEEEIKVHKNILAASSVTFKKMFEHEFEETRTNVLTIHDHSTGAVNDFVRFIYTGEIETEENAMELYNLSVLYNFPELKELCEELVVENLNEVNVLEIFNMGELHSASRLKRAAVKKMMDAFPGKKLDAEMLSEPAEFYNFVKAKRQLDSLLDKFEI